MIIDDIIFTRSAFLFHLNRLGIIWEEMLDESFLIHCLEFYDHYIGETPYECFSTTLYGRLCFLTLETVVDGFDMLGVVIFRHFVQDEYLGPTFLQCVENLPHGLRRITLINKLEELGNTYFIDPISYRRRSPSPYWNDTPNSRMIVPLYT